MQNNSKILKIFSSPDIKHGLSLFSNNEINSIESLIIEHDGKFSINCQIRNRNKKAKPEEVVRQLWIYRLLMEYRYPKKCIDVERLVYFGSRESGKADIVVLHEDLSNPYIIFEVKRPSRKAGLEQLKSYCNAEGAPIGIWSNGNEMIRLHREDPNIFIEIPRIPRVSETLREILTERWTIDWLEEHDELKLGKTTLKKIILDLEELVLGNAGVDPFEEIFKLIYAKLYDEWKGINDPDYQLEFIVGDRSPEQVKRATNNLLEKVKRQWGGVFEPTDKIELRDNHLKICVSFLSKIKLFNSNLQIIDEAFEYLIPQVSKKKEGQFFTPRPVVDMVVKMLNPKTDEFVIDPACGSAGFLLHSVMWVAGGVIDGRELQPSAKNFAQNNIMGIDFAKKPVKIAKAINLIVGDGKSHIYKDNSLAPQTWSDDTKVGLRQRLLRFSKDPEMDRENQNRFLYFDFDILVTNPPFAGAVKERDILILYKLAEKKGRLLKRIGRHILFLERSLQYIRPGGRMAIVLPQGLLNNVSTDYIRRFIINEARILGVVGLNVNTFKPHTGTKTSVLLLQKYIDEEKQKIYEIKVEQEEKWQVFFKELEENYQDIGWDKHIDEEDIPNELKDFIETYFGITEELEDQFEDVTEEYEEVEDIKKEKPLRFLINEVQEYKDILEERQNELDKINLNDRKRELKKDIRNLNAKLKKLYKKVYERTLGGQIYLVLNELRITEQFKKFWLDLNIIKQIDYPIFLCVNKKPLKDNSGEYIYKKGTDDELLVDEHGHLIIDHDLDDIAEKFIEFAKEQDFYFWRE